ncbi:uncharacterized protein KY384_000289 [Bacidia gigantensis]|uniref:uncharacterized protein n=1 Tax=Bacidia gigantensis TaxID=2732470 RepID=UPI001D053140|nr:uncharacterized protein KY384_000289 [Bacidia gigantensis]KAG8526296.1 hypothetical protein KY384_000289 [Bacidia gigantensis]
MKFSTSRLVDPSDYQLEGLDGLCDDVPFREHNDPIKGDIGAIRAQEDWKRLVGPLKDFKGGLAPRGNFVAMTMPECLPERLEVISYASEFAYLHDGKSPVTLLTTTDVTDTVSKAQRAAENDHMLEAFCESLQDGPMQPGPQGKKQIQLQLLQEMMAIDKERALISTKAWARFVELAAGRQHDASFTSLETYIPYRILDVGETFWFGMLTFGLGITIPEAEIETCKQLTRPAWIVCGLTNDLVSWDKEYDEAVRTGASGVVNAIWVLMKERSTGIEQAKQLCREIVKNNVKEFLKVVRDNKDNPKLSTDLRQYLEAMLYTLKGHAVWCLTCPRYNQNAEYNDRQLAMLMNGVNSYIHKSANRRCPGFSSIEFIDETPAVRETYEIANDRRVKGSRHASKATSSGASESAISRRSYSLSAGSKSHDTRENLLALESAWPQGTCERISLISLFAPTLYQDQLLADFLHSIYEPRHAASLPAHGLWLAEVAKKSTLSDALTWSIRALSISQIGRRANDTPLVETSRYLYGKALVKLNVALQDVKEGLSSDTLSATLLLSFYEVFNCTSDHSWVRHAGGAGNLIRIRGPAMHRSGFDRSVFLACRFSIIMEAFNQRVPCFLDSQPWRALGWDLRNEFANELGCGGSSLVLDNTDEEFFQRIVALPGYLKENRELINREEATLLELDAMHERGKSYRAQLAQIHQKMSQAMSRAGTIITEDNNPAEDTTFPVAYVFPDIYIASLFCGYQTTISAINISIMSLEARIAGLYTPDKMPAVTTLLGVYNRPSESIDTQSRRHLNGVWYAATRTGNAHKLNMENANHAREICKSARYLARAPFLGPLHLVVSLRFAMRMCITRAEKAWCVRTLEQLGRGVGIANTEVKNYMGPKEGTDFVEWEEAATGSGS